MSYHKAADITEWVEAKLHTNSDLNLKVLDCLNNATEICNDLFSSCSDVHCQACGAAQLVEAGWSRQAGTALWYEAVHRPAAAHTVVVEAFLG